MVTALAVKRPNGDAARLRGRVPVRVRLDVAHIRESTNLRQR
jgi:hypothetical protein